MKRSRRRRKKFASHHLLLLAVALALVLYATYYFSAAVPTKDFNARVLFSETANCNSEERKLVLGVMHNRIKNPAFGNLNSLDQVIRQPGAFSCIDDPGNANWSRSLYPDRMSKRERDVWNDCVTLLLSSPTQARGPSGRPLVYYHDKSITTPSSWRNEAWTAIREVETSHFVFYSVKATR